MGAKSTGGAVVDSSAQVVSYAFDAGCQGGDRHVVQALAEGEKVGGYGFIVCKGA
jgi:hypothetical protein